MSWAVVVPSNRPDRLAEWLKAWNAPGSPHPELGDAHIIVVFDGPASEVQGVVGSAAAELHTWEDIPEWIPRRTDMIRSWGIYRAWLTGADYTLSLDDDVRVFGGGDFLWEYEQVFEAGAVVSPYLDVGAALTSSGKQMRGFPMGQRTRRPVAVQYGGWFGVLDYDAITQLAGIDDNEIFQYAAVPVPYGAAVTTCAMNMAWRTKYAVMMWQLPLFEGRYNRWGDIWSGLLQKRVCDDLTLAMVVNGRAAVRHDRASDPHRNLELEKPGLDANERLWNSLGHRTRSVPPVTLLDVYREYAIEMADTIGYSDPEYARHFCFCLDKWLSLYA